MTSWLHKLPRFTTAMLAVSLAVLGHASAVGAMAPMDGMEHGSSGTICGVLCTSALTERQAPPRRDAVDEDDEDSPAGISPAPLAPPVPRRVVAVSVFSGGPPSKVPLYLRLELIRV